MKRNIFFIIFSICFLFLTIFFSSKNNQTKFADASVSDNVSGFAWSENIGWISFNSTNCDPNNDGLADEGGYYYYDLTSSLSDGQLSPGESVIFDIKFVRDSTVRFTYLIFPFAALTEGAPSPLADVNNLTSIIATNPRSTLDRRTRQITSTATITITNISAQTIFIPFHAVFTINNANGPVSMPEATGGSQYGNGCPTPRTQVANYGVNIDPTTGNFSGYTWSSNMGWISFNRVDTGNPPGPPFNDGSGPIARLNTANNQVTGWAKVLANESGQDGWIKLFYDSDGDGTVNNDNNSDYGVRRSGCDLIGYAWSHDASGWIKFNGSNYAVTTTFCGNNNPVASDLLQTGGNYCVTPSHNFSWAYSDLDSDPQSKFQLQVDDNIDFSSPEVDLTILGTATTQSIPVTPTPSQNQLAYNTNYNWRIKVWDSNNNESEWFVDAAFLTELHLYPTVNFSWTPSIPPKDMPTNFTNNSICYDINNNPTNCAAWLWTFQDGTPDSSAVQNPPPVRFSSSQYHQVSLAVTDPNNLSCTAIKLVPPPVNLNWKEVSPWQ